MTRRSRVKVSRERTPSSWKERTAGVVARVEGHRLFPHGAFAGPPAGAFPHLDVGEPGSA
jgi:hypothetical protein